MTVSGSTLKHTYILDSSTTVFSYTFKIIQDSDMLVELYDTVNDALTTISADDYTVVGAGKNSGTRTVTYAGAAAYDSNYYLILSSNVEYTQTGDYAEGDDFAQETHELNLDRLSIQIRQLKETVNRAVKVAKNLTNPTELTSLETGYLYTDGINWSLGAITVTETEYEGDISAGADASKSAAPNAKDIYVATDTMITYFCYTANTWTPHYNVKVPSGGTVTYTDSAGNTIMTIDENGNIKIKGGIESWGTF